MNTELSKEHYKLLESVAVKNGFSDYQVIATPGSIKGDNFLGIVTNVIIKSGEKTLALFLKSAHTNEAFRKVAGIHQVYEREMFLYERIFPEFKKFQEECNISDKFDSVPKVYACSTEDGHECLIMEDLKSSGYQLWDKTIPMNSKHIKAVLQEYAKFHAISLAMKTKKPDLFAILSEKVLRNVFEDNDLFTNEEKFNAYVKTVMSCGYNVMEGDIVLTECLKKVEAEIPNSFQKDLKDPEYKLVINHGDCWCNNFMFQYKNPKDLKSLKSLRILDWQISSLTTPAYDFWYFFLVSSSKDDLDDYNSYKQIYYKSLCDQVRNFGCDPEELYPYATFEKHLKKFAVFGVFLSIVIFKILLCDSDDAPDLVKSSETDGDLISAFDCKVNNFEAYKKRLNCVLNFVYTNNLI